MHPATDRAPQDQADKRLDGRRCLSSARGNPISPALQQRLTSFKRRCARRAQSASGAFFCFIRGDAMGVALEGPAQPILARVREIRHRFPRLVATKAAPPGVLTAMAWLVRGAEPKNTRHTQHEIGTECGDSRKGRKPPRHNSQLLCGPIVAIYLERRAQSSCSQLRSGLTMNSPHLSAKSAWPESGPASATLLEDKCLVALRIARAPHNTQQAKNPSMRSGSTTPAHVLVSPFREERGPASAAQVDGAEREEDKRSASGGQHGCREANRLLDSKRNRQTSKASSARRRAHPGHPMQVNTSQTDD